MTHHATQDDSYPEATIQGFRREAAASVVVDWRDAGDHAPADLSGELAGQMVVPFDGVPGGVIPFSPDVADLTSYFAGQAGFLFFGDDGDSLWFWPVDSQLSFRLDKAAERSLRQALSEPVDSLLSQGALVFCYCEPGGVDGETVFHFPHLGVNAA